MIVSAHAKIRWSERFLYCGNIETVIKRATPFGSQRTTRDKSALLYDEESSAVFVVTNHVIVTVITYDQAVANMQIAGLTTGYTSCDRQRHQQIEQSLKELAYDHANNPKLTRGKQIGQLNEFLYNRSDKQSLIAYYWKYFNKYEAEFFAQRKNNELRN